MVLSNVIFRMYCMSRTMLSPLMGWEDRSCSVQGVIGVTTTACAVLHPVGLGTQLGGAWGIGDRAAGNLPGYMASALTGSGSAILLACSSWSFFSSAFYFPPRPLVPNDFWLIYLPSWGDWCCLVLVLCNFPILLVVNVTAPWWWIRPCPLFLPFSLCAKALGFQQIKVFLNADLMIEHTQWNLERSMIPSYSFTSTLKFNVLVFLLYLFYFRFWEHSSVLGILQGVFLLFWCLLLCLVHLTHLLIFCSTHWFGWTHFLLRDT